jgi:two-component system sensor histidine kinase KdpD
MNAPSDYLRELVLDELRTPLAHDWAFSPGPVEYPRTHETLAAAAHELRLPLSHIKGFVSSLLREDLEWDEDTRREFLAGIDLESDRLAELVESHLEARWTNTSGFLRADLVFTDPASIVIGALHRVRGLLRERPLRVDVASDLLPVRMDPSQMERVLANLLQNAIKFAPSAAIGISARITETNVLEFAVDDEGPGVPVADRERVFEPFFRRKQRAALSNVQGNGLGLAICHSIVLAHGGWMQVTDRPGGGARFSVFLPAHAERGPVGERGQDEGRNS